MSGPIDISTPSGYRTSSTSFTVTKAQNTLSGTFFNDANGNGKQDSGEQPLAGWRVFLDTNENLVPDADETSTITDSNGAYQFTNLPDGTYYVCAIPETSWDSTSPGTGKELTTTVSNGAGATGLTFGFQYHTPTPQITNFTPGSASPGTTVTLNGAGFTGATNISFGGVSTTDFTINSDTQITATLPASAATGAIFVTVPTGTLTSPTNLTVTPPTISFAVNIYNDANGNGLPDAGEAPLEGWTVFVDLKLDEKDDSGDPTGTTDANGEYVFTGLKPGTYYIGVVPPAGWRQTQPPPAKEYYNTNPNSPFVEGTYGYSQTSAIVGNVYDDVNGNGTQDTTDPGLAGWTVYLDQNGNGILDPGETSTTTDSMGNYVFTDLAPNTYQVAVKSPSGWNETQPAPPNNEEVGTVTTGQVAGTRFGFHSTTNTPVVTSLDPISGPVTSTVTINGYNLTGATKVAFNGVNATFTFVNDTQITAVVPAGATTGPITVTTTKSATNSQTFTVTAGGTFTGTVFDDINGNGVQDAGDGPLAGWTVYLDANDNGKLDPGETSTTTDANGHYSFTHLQPGTYYLNVVGMNGYRQSQPGPRYVGYYGIFANSETLQANFGWTQSGDINGYVYNDLNGDGQPAPSEPGLAGWTVFLDKNGTGKAGGTNPTATTGTDGYYEFSGLALGTYSIKVVMQSGYQRTQPSVQSPGWTATLTSSNLVTSGLYFGVKSGVPPTTLTGISPSAILAGSAAFTLTVNGSGFMSGAMIQWNGTALATTFSSATKLTAQVPASDVAAPGMVSVTVVNPGEAASNALPFTVTPPAPKVTSFTPTSGPVGTVITITGTNLNGVTAVRFHNASAAVFSANAQGTQITVTVPSGALTGTITVTTPGGSVLNTQQFTVTASPVPTVTSFTPTSGPVGTVVTITGTGFLGATVVKFDGTAAAAFTVVSATSITATVPAGATTGTISVTTPGGTATSPSAYTVAATPSPKITSFTPTSGPVGTAITIMGTNLNGVTAVRFHNASATVFSANAQGTQITVTVPSGALTGTITVTTPGGSVQSTQQFTVILPPTVTSFTPTSGPIGTLVTITGTNFTGATLINFHDASTSTFTVNAQGTQITVTVPKGALTGTIKVTTPGGAVTSAQQFTVIPPPTITSFTPSTGPVGTVVTLTGTGFTGATSVTFNGTAAMSFTVASDTSITATVPTGATTGTIFVTTPDGTATSAGAFTVIPAPTITAFTPASGLVGTVVTITGTNFTGASSVKFNGTAATSFTVVSATSITATVPTGATTGTISVVTLGGSATSTQTFTVTVPQPVMTNFYFTPQSIDEGYQTVGVIVFSAPLTSTVSVNIFDAEGYVDYTLVCTPQSGKTTYYVYYTPSTTSFNYKDTFDADSSVGSFYTYLYVYAP